jgi:hypothetical protein
MTKRNSGRGMQVAIVIFGLSTAGMAGLRIAGHYATRSKLGEACLKGCRSGLFCYEYGLLGYCTKECTQPEDCPDPYRCVPAGEVSICKPPPSEGYGKRCWGPDECWSGLCAEFTFVLRGRTCRFQRCVERCGPGRTCPAGSDCIDSADGSAPTCAPVAEARAEAEREWAAKKPGEYPPLMCL